LYVIGSNSEKETKKPNKIEINNFRNNKKVDFGVNVFIITESDLKNLFKKLIGKENEELNINRNELFSHKNFKGWNFSYLEKNRNEDITVLFKFTFEKIKEEKTNKGNNKDVLLINLQNLNFVKKYLELIINQNYSEEYQPFILFLTNENNIDGKQENIRNLISVIAEEKINEKYENDEDLKNKKLNNLIPNEYYMLYNIFLSQYRENEELNINTNESFSRKNFKCWNFTYL
jgi:hypothetical protein